MIARAGWVCAVVAALAVGACWPRAYAAEPAIDRAIVERLVRAVEANASATRDLARATERCKR